MERKKIFDIYVHDGNKCRYALGKYDKDNINDKKTLFCLGINPSTATDEETDVTMTKLENIAFRKGRAKKIEFDERYNSFIMFNICPLIATDPEKLPKNINSVLETPSHKFNIALITAVIKDEAAIEKDTSITILAAWGDLIYSRPWLMDCKNDIIQHIQKTKIIIKWVKMGELTTKKQPRHLSRITYTNFTEYEV